MSALAWVLVVIVVAVVVGVVVWLAMSRRRTAHLQERFGPEYNRVSSTAPSKRAAETELSQREQRRDALHIQPLSEEAHSEYVSEWQTIQAEFVDEPEGAVAKADSLLQRVMSDRGYPVEKFDQRAADLSVDHPTVVENYREGHRLATKGHENGSATEDLRQAMRHYRALFDELVEADSSHERDTEEARR